MAAFFIFCRTSEIEPHHHEARVYVVPAGEHESPLPTRSECRIFDSAELASTECLRMAEAMWMRLQRAGHEVLRLQSIPPDWAECPMQGNEARSRISKSLEHHEEERP
jgi:hypothetical protein